MKTFLNRLSKQKRCFYLLAVCLLFICLNINAFGQANLKYVPHDPSLVAAFYLGNLDKKVSLQQLRQYDFFNAMWKDLAKTDMAETEQTYFKQFIEKPENLGYNIFEPIYFYVKEEGDHTFFTTVIKMGDRSKYEDGLKKLNPETYTANLKPQTGFVVWQNETETYAWNDEVVVNVWSTRKWNPTDLSALKPAPATDTLFSLENDPAVSRLQTNATSFAWIEKVMNRRFLLPMTANEQYKSANTPGNDLHLWIDYSLLQESAFGDLNRYGMASSMSEYLHFTKSFFEILYADTYASLGVRFENGKMAMKTEMYFSEEMRDFYKGMSDVRFNKKFLRYVKGGDQFFGYFYLNYNIEKMIEAGKDLIHKLLASTPVYGEMALDAFQILGIFMDEQAIGKLMKGDLMVSVSGLQTIPVQSTIYEYDAEFNYVPKDTILQQTIPVFTALATYGNDKDIMKFVKLGLHSKTLTPEGRYYKMTIPNGGGDVYLALHNGMLIFTNNRYLVQQNLENGLDKKVRLGKKHKKTLCENSSAFYWNIPNSIKAAAGDQSESNVGTIGYLNVLGKEFESLEATYSKKVGNSIKGEINFHFINKEGNSLDQLCRFINDLYIEFSGGAKI